MKYLVLTMRRADFNADVIPKHYDFLDSLRDRGILEQAGPFTDGSGGAYVITAPDLDDARRIAEQDPLHIENCSTVTVREWNSK